MKKHYNEGRKVKLVSFSEVKDADLIQWIQDKEFSTYVKNLIREDMKK